jgi:hypothetical protein
MFSKFSAFFGEDGLFDSLKESMEKAQSFLVISRFTLG